MAKLSDKQKLFCDEYLIDLNVTQAAIRAGYSAKYANDHGYELLKKPAIKECIDKAIAERSKRTGINQDRVLLELARIALLKPSNVINVNTATVNKNASDDDLATIQSVKIKTVPTAYGKGVEREVKFADKMKALELLGKHLGMFTDKVDLNIGKSEKFADIVEQIGGKGLEE
ncbi:terminase small subunit [Clostridium beijerinckii]|uniref:Phage terminase small subunit n=1 Tax=Clostridium beijerinckii TaxID=1520 RepID=A0AAX0AZ42_CLOBE|nr:terminase small subunit [Clostridium beijerinckii]NRT88116.1 phage terminase small subunit [Clostridium beijerinckii]NYC73544.1 phage terminase small subunit [Clostridium beijerinckii]